MKYYYDGITPYEDYPIDMDIECYNCKYEYDCFHSDATKTPMCLIELKERESNALDR
jgi:hypothetical protein